MSELYHSYCRTYQAAMRLAAGFLDWTEPKVLSGKGAVRDLADLVSRLGCQPVLVVSDPGLRKLGVPDGLLQSLSQKGVAYALYDGVQPNPTIANIEACRNVYLQAGCQAIIAIGGGSVMDCAKAAGARVVRPNRSIPQMRGQLKVGRPLPPLFAVPTTAGTGSETTVCAVVTNPETHEKFAINDPHLRPKYAVLDPELTVGLPPFITATTGMDALTHAVEAYIGQSNTRETEKAAIDAVRLIFANLPEAYRNGTDLRARENMLLGSYYAGLAFTRAYVGYVHAIAHTLGGLYGIAHGLANAVILPYILDYDGDCISHRLSRLAEAAGIGQDLPDEPTRAQAMIAAIRQMNQQMKIPEHLPQIQTADLALIAKRAMREGNPLYPVPKIMNEAECIEILKQLKG